jgi:hypothetical protein
MVSSISFASESLEANFASLKQLTQKIFVLFFSCIRGISHVGHDI